MRLWRRGRRACPSPPCASSARDSIPPLSRAARRWCPEVSLQRRPARPAVRSGRPSTPPRPLPIVLLTSPPRGEGQGGDDRRRPLLHGENARHRVEGHDIGQQALDLELALQQLEGDAAPDLVVVNRQPEQPDLEVAQAHHGVRVGANGERAPWLEAVVDDELAALEVEGDALIDVGDPDADASLQRLEVALLLRMAPYVGLDQAPEHRRKRAWFIVVVTDERAAVDVEP